MLEASAAITFSADVERKTRAADGAGTTIEHVPGDEHGMVRMVSGPSKRPSEAKLSPNV